MIKKVISKIQTKIFKIGRSNYILAKIVTPLYKMTASDNEKQEVVNNINLFVKGRLKEDSRYMSHLIEDIWFSLYYYKITPDEYFLFEFERLSWVGRNEFVGNTEKEALCYRQEGVNVPTIYRGPCYTIPSTAQIFLDKWSTFEKFKAFFKREVIKIESDEDYDSFSSFYDNHENFVVKPTKGSRGNGVELFEKSKHAESKEDVFKWILSKGVCLMEERMNAVHEIQEFHPLTVQSIRVATYNNKGNVTIIGAYMRIGMGGNFVDSGPGGGMLASINMKTGVVDSEGIDDYGNRYQVHPESGKVILGFCIPKFEDMKKTAVELAKVIPEQKYVGWDLVLTDKGWSMMEGNCGGQFISFQMTIRKGNRAMIEHAFMGRNIEDVEYRIKTKK